MDRVSGMVLLDRSGSIVNEKYITFSVTLGPFRAWTEEEKSRKAAKKKRIDFIVFILLLLFLFLLCAHSKCTAIESVNSASQKSADVPRGHYDLGQL